MEKKAAATSHDHGHDHKAAQISLMVNGINCGGCKKALDAKLRELPGIVDLSIATKTDTGVHPNKVVITGDVDEAAVKAKIDELDAGRGKYTITAHHPKQ